MRFLIIGSSGFIGRHLHWYLNSREQMVGLCDLTDGIDIRDYDMLSKVFSRFKPHIVYHLAAQVFAGPSETHPSNDIEVNINGTINVIRCVAECEHSNVLVFSSTQAVVEPWSNYAVSKMAAEEYIKKYTRQGLIQGKIVRFSSVYGPDRYSVDDDEQVSWHGPINRFLYQGMKKTPITVYGTGDSMRDYTHISDVVRAMEYVRLDGQIGGTYNIGTGTQHSVSDIADLAKFISKSRRKAKYFPDKGGDDFKSGSFNVQNLFKLGFVPRYDLYSGMLDTYSGMEKICKELEK